MSEQWAHPQNSNGIYPTDGSANGMLDGFTPNSVDLNQFQNAQLQQRMQNGGMRNASPAFQNPQYNVNQIIPSKRPRPSEDGIAASPRQPSHPNLSRSHTPHQAGGFQGFPGNQQQPPNPYQHLQQSGSANATPSPTLQDTQFRPPGAAQRMNASPSPFPGAQPGMGMSPPPDANGNRVNTPHNPSFPMNGMGMPPSSMPQGYNQNFGGTPSMTPGQMQGGGMPQQVALSQNLAQRQAEANRLYQMRLQQQQQNLASQNQRAQAQHQIGMMGGNMGAMPAQNQNMNTPTRNPQNMNIQAQTMSFMKNLQMFMAQNNKPFDPSPVVCNQRVSLYQLYMVVMKAKGSGVVTSKNQWPQVAQMLGFQQPNLVQQAAQELRMVYEKNLAPYESAYWRSRQDPNKQMNQQAPGMHPMNQMNQQMSPTRPASSAGSELQQQQAILQQQYLAQMQQRQQAQQQMGQQQMGQMTPQQSNASLPATNGWSTPTDPTAQRQGSMGAPSKMKPEQSPAVQQPGLAAPSPATTEKFPVPDGQPPEQGAAAAAGGQAGDNKLVEHHGTHYIPKQFHLMDHHGGITVKAMDNIGSQIDTIKPVVPDVEEMGLVDIRALCMSLQSGIEGEVRYALDHLIKCSFEQRFYVIELEKAEDLVDVLVDCAQDQVDKLSEDATEVSDAVDVAAYEDVMRHARAEIESLQDIPDFATPAYELDRAADRLIAITTILRNLSFWPQNHPQLASEQLVKFLSSTIRLLGTTHHLLRSFSNTQDFMKDVVIFLSNVSDKIELPSREDALNILNFLVAFAPQPSPTSSPVCRFTRYNPAIHRYLPPAVDSLAKLLARDDPNRAYYKYLFVNDPSAINPKLPPHQQYDLLTRAFALAISVIPDRTALRNVAGTAEYRIAEVRKPYLIQGMLAGDILATLVPNSDSGLARAWLEAEDGWAPSLLRLACTLSTDRMNPQQTVAQGGRRPPDHELGFGLVTHRALGMLQKLGEKTKNELLNLNGATQQKDKPVNGEKASDEQDDAMDSSEHRNGDGEADSDDEQEQHRKQLLKVMADVLPQREVLLGALLTANIEAGALKQLCAFAALEV